MWYLQVEESQCAYGREEYVLERAEGTSINTVRLSVDPFHVEHPGLRYALPARRPVSWLVMVEQESPVLFLYTTLLVVIVFVIL